MASQKCGLHIPFLLRPFFIWPSLLKINFWSAYPEPVSILFFTSDSAGPKKVHALVSTPPRPLSTYNNPPLDTYKLWISERLKDLIDGDGSPGELQFMSLGILNRGSFFALGWCDSFYPNSPPYICNLLLIFIPF